MAIKTKCMAVVVGVLGMLLFAPRAPLAGGAVPGNDLCENAAGPLAVPSDTGGSTLPANPDTAPFCGTSDGNGGGVWYTVVGTGNVIFASTCGAADFDTKIRVYCDSCESLECVTGNDDSCGLQTMVAWCGQEGTVYRILVHGFGSAEGNFTLNLSEGAPCEDAIACGEDEEVVSSVPAMSLWWLAALSVALLSLGLGATHRRLPRTT